MCHVASLLARHFFSIKLWQFKNNLYLYKKNMSIINEHRKIY